MLVVALCLHAFYFSDWTRYAYIHCSKIGGRIMIYDIVIIGGGPGGMSAAIYAARAGLKTVLLEKAYVGGQMTQAHEIDNYPGEDGIDGFSLAEKMRQGAEKQGVQIVYEGVQKVNLNCNPKAVETSAGTYYGKCVIYAAGAEPRKLNLPGEQEMTGKGVSYCAACDGMFYKGKTVVVCGGGDSAAGDAILLGRVAERVIIVHRRDSMRAAKSYRDKLESMPNVEFVWNSTVTELIYGDKITGIKTKNIHTGDISDISCDGVFISIGRIPQTELVKGQLDLNDSGYITADETTRTNIPGVYAVGDVREKALRQIVTATSDGAAAVHFAEESISVSFSE